MKGRRLVFTHKGRKYYEGDRVRGEKTLVLPSWDGWGNDIPRTGPAEYQTMRYEGVVYYDLKRGEGGVDVGHGKMPVYQFDMIEPAEA